MAIYEWKLSIEPNDNPAFHKWTVKVEDGHVFEESGSKLLPIIRRAAMTIAGEMGVFPTSNSDAR
jgi:hypothetical protein